MGASPTVGDAPGRGGKKNYLILYKVARALTILSRLTMSRLAFRIKSEEIQGVGRRTNDCRALYSYTRVGEREG